jgi:uncharacterized membrane protein
MKHLLRIIGWIGIVVLSLLDLGNPTTYDRKPDEETVMIIGVLVLVAIVICVVGIIVVIVTPH